MRRIILGVGLALACATAAAAQPAVLVKSKPIQGTVPDFDAELPGKVTRWEKAEIDRQFENPTAMFDLELAMLTALEPELQSVAKHKKLSYEEVRVLVLYDVITGAAKKMDRAVHDRRAEIDKAGVPDKQDAEMRSLGRRKEALASLIGELGPRMTPNTRLLSSGGSGPMVNQGALGK